MGLLDTLIYGYRTIYAAGVEITRRNRIDFGAGFTAVDNPTTGATEVSSTGPVLPLDLTTDVTGTLPAANGGTGITSLGSGVATFLGTPSGANLANALTTALPATDGGTGINSSALTGVAKVTAGTWSTFAIGAGVETFLTTPSGANLAAALTTALPTSKGGTGIDSSALTGVPKIAAGTWSSFTLGTGVETFLGTPSSANLAAALTDETGSGSAVFGTSPTLATPIITDPCGTGALRTGNGLRLTLTTGVPVTTADVTGATTIYLTPYTSGTIALYDGSKWCQYDTAQVSLAVGTLVNGTNYDVFAYYTGGAVTLEFAAWLTDTARNTNLVRQDGVWCKTGALTRRYLGTFRTTSTTTVEDSFSKRYLWNFYNRVPRALKKIPTTNTTATGTAAGTFRAYLNDANNKVEVVVGELDSSITIDGQGHARHTASDFGMGTGIGIDSTTADSSQTKNGSYTIANAYTFPQARYRGQVSLGYHAYSLLEISSVAGTFYADNNFPSYHQAGIVGTILG